MSFTKIDILKKLLEKKIKKGQLHLQFKTCSFQKLKDFILSQTDYLYIQDESTTLFKKYLIESIDFKKIILENKVCYLAIDDIQSFIQQNKNKISFITSTNRNDAYEKNKSALRENKSQIILRMSFSLRDYSNILDNIVNIDFSCSSKTAINVYDEIFKFEGDLKYTTSLYRDAINQSKGQTFQDYLNSVKDNLEILSKQRFE